MSHMNTNRQTIQPAGERRVPADRVGERRRKHRKSHEAWLITRQWPDVGSLFRLCSATAPPAFWPLAVAHANALQRAVARVLGGRRNYQPCSSFPFREMLNFSGKHFNQQAFLK